MTFLLFLLWACDAEPEKAVEPKPTPVVRRVEVEPAASKVDSETEEVAPVDVNMAFSGISNLHRGFFLQRKGVQELGRALGRCFSKAVTVEVGYSNDELKGYIYLVTSERTGKCVPKSDAAGLDLSSLQNIGGALAVYRDFVAGTSDFRISNFKIGIRYEEPTYSCALVAMGQNPPDGTTWSICPEDTRAEKCPEKSIFGSQFAWNALANVDRVKACF